MNNKYFNAWKLKVNKIKELGLMPKNFNTSIHLCEFLKRIDPVLVLMPPTVVHELFGKRPDKDGKESDKSYLSAKKAKQLMDCEEFEREKKIIWENIFASRESDIGTLAELALIDMILARHPRMVEIGLQMGKKWTPKQIKEVRDDTKLAKEISKLVQKAVFGVEDIVKPRGNK